MQLLRLLPFGLLVCSSALAQVGPVVPRLGESMADAIFRERFNLPATTDKVPAAPPVFYPVLYWTRGILQTYTGAVSRPWLKFDIINQQLYSRSAADEPEAVNMADLRAFAVGDSLSGTRHVYRRYLNARLENAALRTAFFEVRYDAGRTVLLCYRVIAEGVANGQGSAARRERITYFIKAANGNLIVPVELNQRAVLTALKPVHKSALAAYADEKALKLSRERDVIRLLAYYDGL